jgi:hypothetical protein
MFFDPFPSAVEVTLFLAATIPYRGTLVGTLAPHSGKWA